MSARQIIEDRLGRKLPPTPDLSPDEREAIKRLAMALIRNNPTAAALRAAAKRRLSDRNTLGGDLDRITRDHRWRNP